MPCGYYFDDKRDGLVRVSTKNMVMTGYIKDLNESHLALDTKGGAAHVPVAKIVHVIPVRTK